MHDIFKGVRRETTIATIIIEVASTINELLLRKISELAILLHKVRFHGAHGGESPAAAALSLVLNGGNNTEVSPIPMSRDILKGQLNGASLLGILVSGRALLIISNNIKIVGEFGISHI